MLEDTTTTSAAQPDGSVDPGRSASTTDGPGEDAATAPRASAQAVIDTVTSGSPVDRRLFGTNVPAWLGPERLRAEWLLAAIRSSGVTTLRMPGGSWSNEYGWSACELRLGEGCIWDGAARPSDYAELLSTTGLQGIWTVSVNETAQSAAALVAFFHGDIDDARQIGIDRDGRDWGTVGDWARVRAEGGHTTPVRIEMWEIGNEVFGGRPDTGGSECASFGWEEVWTCDGRAYVEGDADHDGYLDIRRAMLEVDPTVQVGAVGVAEADSWSDWGIEIIDGTPGELDFYVVHAYGFDGSPGIDAAARRARELWPDVIESVRKDLPADVAIAVTEYNLVSFEAGDTERSMTKAYNALFIASTIGQLARLGVPIANQWNLANGTTGSGTDYGLVNAETGAPFPQFTAMAVWGRAGTELLGVEVSPDAVDVEVYPTRRSDGSIHVVIVNAGDAITFSLGLTGAAPEVVDGTVWAVGSSGATELTESTVVHREVAEAIEFELSARSLSELELEVAG